MVVFPYSVVVFAACLLPLLFFSETHGRETISRSGSGSSEAFDIVLTEDIVKCKVCERAVSHVWQRGLALRHHCIATKGVDRDHRCDFHNVHPWAIDQMVWGVCDALPRTYQAIHESEFDLVLRSNEEDVDHTEEVINLLWDVCNKFVHQHHGAEILGEKIQGHLQAGHTDASILEPLTLEVCSHVCPKKRGNAKGRPQKKVWHPVHDDL